jgi:hypothetical protein
MNCRDVVSLLSDYLDGRDMWFSDSEVQDIEAHLDDCPKCKRVQIELTEIRSAARELPLHTPSRALWTRISNIVEVDVPASERPTRIEIPEMSWWERFKSRKMTLSLPQLAGTSALATALIIFGIYVASNPTTPRKAFDFQAGTSAIILPDEDKIKADLERKLSLINARKGNWDPLVRDEFDKHLKKIEEALQNSRQILQYRPDDKVQRQMVLTLYHEKRQLLDDVERLKW